MEQAVNLQQGSPAYEEVEAARLRSPVLRAPSIESRPCRRPSISDLMIFIAGAAVALEITRSSDIPVLAGWWDNLLVSGFFYAISFLKTSTFAWLMIRLRPPRSDLRRIARQGGFVACTAASLETAIFFAVYLLFGYPFPAVDTAPVYHFVGLFFGGLAVGAGWLLRAWFGLRESEPGWIDRSGRILGYLWLFPTCFMLVGCLINEMR